MASDSILALDCWFRGDTIERIFNVAISPTETVTALKKSIKDGRPVDLRGIDPSKINLYAVSVPVEMDDEELENKLATTTLRRGLGHRAKLSQIFTRSQGKQWIVIVDVPELPRAICCWLRGDPVNSIFVVHISGAKFVSDLKESIKEKKPLDFHGVQSDAITLYKVSIPCDDHLPEALVRLDLGSDTQPKPLDILSNIFVELPPQHIHIVIESPTPDQARNLVLPTNELPVVPPISINCWLRGDPINSIFVVHISGAKFVSDLKESIKEKKPLDFHGVQSDAMTLHKVSIPCDDHLPEALVRLDLGSDTLLKPLDTLSGIFGGSHPQQIHVVIVPPDTHRAYTSSPLSSLLERAKFLRNVPSVAPSAAAVSKVFFTQQQNSEKTMLCNRPYSAQATVPVTLLHPAFGKFLDDCEGHIITPEDNGLALKLHIAMANHHPDERSRAEWIRGIFLAQDVDFHARTMDGGYTTDGDLSVGEYRYAIVEFKNEIGYTGAEPYNQAVCYYLEATRKHATESTSCFPCILILLFGPYIVFVGAAWNKNRPVIQTLSYTLPMHYHDTDVKMRTSVARHLGALKKMLHTLKSYYDDFEDAPTAQSALFPYPTHFTSLEDKIERKFTYTTQPFEDKLIFFGTLDDNKHPICIKFVRRYSKHVHQACASLGCAPKLHGLEKVAGGWLMVIMDNLTEQYVLLREVVGSPQLISNIRDTLTKLHEMRYVHGDVRDANIMVLKAKVEMFMLIDFDWAGKIDEVRYPMNVTKSKLLWRPESVEDEALILAGHDMDMLREIARRNV